MWELQLKKMSQSKDKGVKVIDRLFQDTEKVLAEMKKLVDNCLTDTKLCDEPCLSVVMGEYLQVQTFNCFWLITNQLPDFLSAIQVTIQLMDHSAIGHILFTIRIPDVSGN